MLRHQKRKKLKHLVMKLFQLSLIGFLQGVYIFSTQPDISICHVCFSVHAGIVDLADITSYLYPFAKTTVFNLGLVMGLDYNRLKSSIDSPGFLADMLAGWLQRVDQVQKAGVPTWRKLVEALRDPRVGQNGIARNVEQDKL